MDIREYKYILAIAESGGITEAARKLFISQPALSIFLNSLENRIGVKLFLRQRNCLYLTESGKMYVEYAKRISSLDDALGRELADIKNLTRGEVVLGVTETRGMNLLHLQLPVYRSRYPGITVKLVEGHSYTLERMLHDRTIDIAVLSQTLDPDDLEFTLLSKEEVILIVPADFTVNQHAVERPGERSWMDIRHLENEPFILLHKEQRIRQLSDMLFSEAGISPQVVWELSSATTTYKLATKGLGICILTANYHDNNFPDTVNTYSVGTPPLVSNIVAAYLKKENLSKSALAMLDTIIETYPYPVLSS